MQYTPVLGWLTAATFLLRITVALGGVGGFYREVRIPNLRGGLHLGGAFGPDLPPPRPRPAPHPVPPRRGRHPGRRDRPAARPPPVDHLPRAGPQPFPRRRPRVLRLLPPERPRLGAAAPVLSGLAPPPWSMKVGFS